MDDFVVRWFQPQDTDAVVWLHSENIRWFEEVSLTREFVVESSRRIDFKIMVAESRGEVVGFVGALYFEAVGRAEIGPISISSGFQNRTIGSSLLSELLKFLWSLGIRRCIAHVKTSNQNAIKFFLANNFVFEGYLRKYTQMGEDVVQMVHLQND